MRNGAAGGVAARSEELTPNRIILGGPLIFTLRRLISGRTESAPTTSYSPATATSTAPTAPEPSACPAIPSGVCRDLLVGCSTCPVHTEGATSPP